MRKEENITKPEDAVAHAWSTCSLLVDRQLSHGTWTASFTRDSDSICDVFETKDGRFTGRYVRPGGTEEMTLRCSRIRIGPWMDILVCDSIPGGTDTVEGLSGHALDDTAVIREWYERKMER